MIIPVMTSDGSFSLFNKQLGEHYHSTFGAITESRHVFIRHGLMPLISRKNDISIMEIGFGTGLNALLTMDKCFRSIQLYYETIDILPLEQNVITQLNYTENDDLKAFADQFLQMHLSAWNEEVSLNEHFIFKKILISLHEYKPALDFFDLIYFDAFSPGVQPDLWSMEVFEQLYASLKKEGTLVTYSARGLVKSALRNAGFSIERLPGPPGKRHMIRARKL
jgi:tRNA U34 5-methylaminomethyl-2-thiouridine-forming methyltransferase MnmC